MNEEGLCWVSGLKPKPKALNKNIKILPNSKHIDVYTQKSCKRHFGLNGSGLESQFDCLQKVTFRTLIRLTMLYLNKIFKYTIVKYAGCYTVYVLKEPLYGLTSPALSKK